MYVLYLEIVGILYTCICFGNSHEYICTVFRMVGILSSFLYLQILMFLGMCLLIGLIGSWIFEAVYAAGDVSLFHNNMESCRYSRLYCSGGEVVLTGFKLLMYM